MRCFLIIFKCFPAISLFRNNPFFSLLLSSTPLLLSFPSLPYLFLLLSIPFMNCDVFAPCIKSLLCFPSFVLLKRPVTFSMHSIHLSPFLCSSFFQTRSTHLSLFTRLFQVLKGQCHEIKTFLKVLKIKSVGMG